jgi:hypothetical protein
MMSTTDWLRGLLSAAVSSASTAVLAFLGIPAVGLTINFKQFAVFIAADVIVSLATFLKANPIPTETTTTTIRPGPGGNVTLTDTKTSTPPTK